jgi:hypothetical protein
MLSKIENTIINTYKEINGLKKRSNLVLTNQLYKGFFKIYKEKRFNLHNSHVYADDTWATDVSGHKLTEPVVRNNLVMQDNLSGNGETKNNYMLKISGVWENAEEIGITYKFIEIGENTL